MEAGNEADSQQYGDGCPKPGSNQEQPRPTLATTSMSDLANDPAGDSGAQPMDEIDQSIRLFQTVVETLVLDHIGKDGVVPPDLMAGRDWWRTLAIVSGIASTAVDGHTLPSAPPSAPALTFHPTPAALEELYHAHRFLRTAPRRLDGKDADALRVLAAIGAELSRNGLRAAYVAAARRARAASNTRGAA